MSLSLKLETCEIFLSYAIVYRRPPSCFYCGGCPAHVSPCTPAVDMRTSWLLCVVICLTFDPNNTSNEGTFAFCLCSFCVSLWTLKSKVRERAFFHFLNFVMNFLKGVVSKCHNFRNTGQPGRINSFDRCF